MDNVRILDDPNEFNIDAGDYSIVFRFGDLEIVANTNVAEKIIGRMNEEFPQVRPVSKRFNYLFCSLCGDCISEDFDYVTIDPVVTTDEHGLRVANEAQYFHKICWENENVA